MLYLTNTTSSKALPLLPRMTQMECSTSATYRTVDMTTSSFESPRRKASSSLPTAVSLFGWAMTMTDLPRDSSSSLRMSATVLFPEPSMPSTTYHAMGSEPQQDHGR